MDDEQRYLAPAAGYVSTPARAMDPLEAVPADVQEAQTDQARQLVLEDRIARRQATSREISRELEFHRSRVRYLERELKRLSRPVS